LKSRFERPNPKHFKAKNMGFWAGNIPRTIKQWEIEDQWLMLSRAALEVIEEVLAEHDMVLDDVKDRTIAGEKIDLRLKKELRPYQVEAVRHLIATASDKHRGAVVRGPCGSGKTCILLGSMAAVRRPTLVVVHTKPLMDQWLGECVEWFGIVPGSIGGGRKETIKDVTVGMQQTIHRRIKDGNAPWLERFGLMVGDEIHRFAAKTFQEVVERVPAAMRLGASADERRKDGLEFLIYDTFGPCAHQITRDELLQLHRLVPIAMCVVPTEFECESYVDSVLHRETPDWNGMISEMVDDDERNALILDRVMRELRDPSVRMLLLNDRVDPCVRWVRVLNARGVPAGLMIGGSKNANELAATKRGLLNGDLRVGVGTKVADEGLDIPPLTHVVLTTPVAQHPKRLEQMIGRAARTCGGKETAVVIYFWDRKMFPAPKKDENGDDRARRERNFIRRLENLVDDIEVE